MNRCHMYLWLCNRWLNFRMQLVGGLTAGSVGLAIVLLVSWNRNTDSTLYISNTAAGLALVYSLTFTDNLTWLARFHADNQLNMNAIERILEFASVESENYHPNPNPNPNPKNASSLNATQPMHPDDFSVKSFLEDVFFIITGREKYGLTASSVTIPKSHNIPDNWPDKGSVEFRDISLVYRGNPSTINDSLSSIKLINCPNILVDVYNKVIIITILLLLLLI